MSKQRVERVNGSVCRKRRRFTDEFKAEAVQLLLDGHTAVSICERLGLSSPNVLYRWKREAVRQGGATAVGLEGRVRELEAELRRVERERDILPLEMSISPAHVFLLLSC
jgi:transposase